MCSGWRWDRLLPQPESRRGKLRIYLGAAPGVGKTFAMLNEGRRRCSRGTDVVVGFVETHGRPTTADQIGDLEVFPRRTIEYRGTAIEELDIDGLLARKPEQALVDELAHTNAPGSRNAKRWQDIDELLDAGIDVISTVNIQHLESLNDVVEQITGVKQRETVPDAWVRAADQIELVDMTPEALRRRMAHGNIYPAERIDAALGNYFRVGNLGALRELALLWVADRVDDELTEYRERHGIQDQWATRERVVVALTGAPGGDQLIRRAGRMAVRGRGELLGVHVRSDDGMRAASTELLDAHRKLLEELGGRYLEVVGSDVPRALLDVARAENATQLLLGASQRSRWAELVRGSVINKVIRESGPIDVHVISTVPEEGDREGPSRSLPRPNLRSRLPRQRLLAGWAIALLGPPALTAVMAPHRSAVELSTVLLLFLLVVVAAAAVGGGGPALVAAVTGSQYVNWFFVPPIHEWTIEDPDHVVELVIFVIVGLVVAWLVATVTRRSAEVARARAEAETLARIASVPATTDPLQNLAVQLRDAFVLDAVSILSRQEPTGTAWTVEAAAGLDPPATPEAADEIIDLAPTVKVALQGGRIAAEDRHVLRAFADQLAAAIEGERLTEQAETAATLAQANELRTALLAAVSHDLRTPLASIKASITSLLANDVDWPSDAVHEFHQAIDEETDRLTALVGNLLDMSRIATSAVQVRPIPVGVEEIVPAALASLGDRARHGQVEVAVPETLPRVRTDPALVERAIANLVDNALAWSPPEVPVRVEAGAVSGAMHLRIVDRGPGIPVSERERVFQPFQREGDRSHGPGVGLGLAVARGFVEAVGGELSIEDTPGGGTTMVVVLPVENSQ